MAEDFEKNLYESFHLDFGEPLFRALSGGLAAVVAKGGTGELIPRVGPSSLSIIRLRLECLIIERVGVRPTPFLHLPFAPTFPLGTPTASASTAERPFTTWPFNRTHTPNPQTVKQEIEAEIERIASRLFTVVVTSGQYTLTSETETLIQT